MLTPSQLSSTVKLKVIRDENGVAVDFKTEKDFPRYGNNDDRADEIAAWLVRQLYTKMNKHHLYRDAKLSTSVLTITSNVVYGKNTGTTPNTVKQANHSHQVLIQLMVLKTHGALASLLSVAKLPYRYATDGISNTFAVTPSTLGHDEKLEEKTLVNMISGYMKNEGHHLNINVFNRDTLLDAQKHPEEYPTLTVRVFWLLCILR